MDVTTEPKEQQEPSMEEILSSIRRIIADEEAEGGEREDGELGAAEAQAEARDQDADALAQAAEEDDAEDVLELTKVVRESGEVVDLRADSGAAPIEPAATSLDPIAAAEPGEAMEPSPVEAEADRPPVEEHAEQPPISGFRDDGMEEHETATEMNKGGIDSLVSDQAAGIATGAFAKLSQAVQRTPPEVAVADGSGRTVEQFVEDIARPMLREWLDQNMPPLVERIVQKEIQKIARRAEID